MQDQDLIIPQSTGLNYYQKNRNKILERSKKYYYEHKDKIKKKHRAYIKKTKERWREYQRNIPTEKKRIYLRTCRYGLSDNEFNKLLRKQQSKCAICKNTVELTIDHCHKTNRVRGLLCQKCNSILGYANESISILKDAINYLQKERI